MNGLAISSIPDDAMDNLVNTLTTLSLYNNSLHVVPKTISKLKGLTMLVLQQNEIIDVSSLPSLSKLSTLYLNNNNISNHSQLSTALRHYTDWLATLAIDNNNLAAIPELNFFKNVGSLDFSHNRISDTNSGSVPSAVYGCTMQYNSLPSIPKIMANLKYVTDLVLAHNVITHIEGSQFPPSTIVVDLEYNLLTKLTNRSFPENSSITFINLNNNPISEISPTAFENLRDIRELRMQYSALTRLPLALLSLTSLYFLDMSNSTGLVCTCLEKSLETWIQSFYLANVVGSCGQISIYNFLKSLSTQCPTLEA